jgi:hypothetical protein
MQADTFVCVKACFYQNRLWRPGEALAPQAGEVPPKWFKKPGEYQEPKKVEVKEPRTLAEAAKINPFAEDFLS